MGRPNPQNLKVPTPEEARRNGAKGGKASGESRKRKKTMMELLENLLTVENEDEAIGKTMKKMGFEKNDNYHMVRILSALIRKAEDGDLKAVDTVIKLMYGNTQDVNVNVEGSMNVGQRVQIYLPERDELPE